MQFYPWWSGQGFSIKESGQNDFSDPTVAKTLIYKFIAHCLTDNQNKIELED
jgi:hypothetical protein